MSKYRITLNGEVYEMEVEAIDGDISPVQPAAAAQTAVSAPAAQSEAHSSAAEPADGAVVSPMPGTVVKLVAAQGEKVAKGQPVLVLEAMKMENEITAPKDGVLSSVYVSEGQTVAGGEALFEIGE